jgi:phosphoserine phosphatase RsbU/P
MRLPADAIPGGLLTLSADLRILSANAALAAMVDRPVGAIVGEPLDALLTPPSRILFQTHVYPALRTEGRVDEMFLTLAGADATAVPILVNARRVNETPEHAYTALVVRVGARMRWEADLLEATRALERERAASAQLTTDLAAALEDLERK